MNTEEKIEVIVKHTKDKNIKKQKMHILMYKRYCRQLWGAKAHETYAPVYHFF